MHHSGDLNVLDKNGTPITGLYRKPDGSFVNRNKSVYDKSVAQQSAFIALNNEVAELKEQIKTILEHINGKHHVSRDSN